MFYYCYAFPLQRTKEEKKPNEMQTKKHWKTEREGQRNTEKLNVKVKETLKNWTWRLKKHWKTEREGKNTSYLEFRM